MVKEITSIIRGNYSNSMCIILVVTRSSSRRLAARLHQPPRSHAGALSGRARGAPPRADRRIKQLEEIGRQLRLALELGARCALGRRAVWDHAEKATEALGELVLESVSLREAVLATGARVMRHG